MTLRAFFMINLYYSCTLCKKHYPFNYRPMTTGTDSEAPSDVNVSLYIPLTVNGIEKVCKPA